MGIASLSLGILSLIMIFLFIIAQMSFGAIPSYFAIAGIVLGIMGIKNENDWIIKGTLVFRENNVILNIEYSSSDLIKTGSITFEKASKSILQ